MLNDYEEDFFYEEDKIKNQKELSVIKDKDSSHRSFENSKDNKNTMRNASNDDEINVSIEELENSKIKDDLKSQIVDGLGIKEFVDDGKLYYSYQKFEMERLGMTITSGSVVIKKDQSNLIGISIGGGAPLCPCLYIVQVFDGTPAAKEGSLQSGDELASVNGNTVKGKTKVEVAKMIQSATTEVVINYNKLHADPTQGQTLDIILKKFKHRLVDTLSSSTADTLGLSRAILCNDSLVKRLQELEATEQMYKGLVEHAKRMLKAYFDLLQTFQAFGNIFADISVRETQVTAAEAFRMFSELHRNMEKDGVKMLKSVKPVLADLGTYLNKAIPDTKMTIRKYANAKFTYLSYCLKVKEMDDEEHSYAALQEPLYRVETGNYEYRLILRCRQEARAKFAQLRNDVLEKMELLESKHATDLCGQLRKFLQGLATLGNDIENRIKELPTLFPIEVDLKESAFQYKTNQIFTAEDEEDIVSPGEEARENERTNLIEGFEEIKLTDSNSTESNILGDTIQTFSGAASEDLLAELGLDNIDLTVDSLFSNTGTKNSTNTNLDLLQ